MGSLSIWHWLIVLAVILLLLGGRGRVSSLMSDLGKGIKSFKQSMAEEDKSKPSADAQMSEPSTLGAPQPEQKFTESQKTPTNTQG